MYVVYMGDSTYRLPMTCGAPLHTAGCEQCDRWSVAMITWLMVSQTSTGGRDGLNAVFDHGFPIEDLADRTTDALGIRDLNRRHCDRELGTFLRTPQTGARLVTKTVLRVVSDARRGMFSMDTIDAPPGVSDRVFVDVPNDSGHFTRPYLDHVLRGLRSRPPAYVQDLLAGLPLSRHISELVSGVAVFAC